MDGSVSQASHATQTSSDPQGSSAPPPGSAPSARPRCFAERLPDGSVALLDRERRVVVRYDGDTLTLGDGRANLALVTRGEVAIDAGSVRIASRSTTAAWGDASFSFTALRESARKVVREARELETRAARKVEELGVLRQTVTDVVEHRWKRARTFVDDTFALRARKTKVASTEDTSIDGRRVLLG